MGGSLDSATLIRRIAKLGRPGYWDDPQGLEEAGSCGGQHRHQRKQLDSKSLGDRLKMTRRVSKMPKLILFYFSSSVLVWLAEDIYFTVFALLAFLLVYLLDSIVRPQKWL